MLLTYFHLFPTPSPFLIIFTLSHNFIHPTIIHYSLSSPLSQLFWPPTLSSFTSLLPSSFSPVSFLFLFFFYLTFSFQIFLFLSPSSSSYYTFFFITAFLLLSLHPSLLFPYLTSHSLQLLFPFTLMQVKETQDLINIKIKLPFLPWLTLTGWAAPRLVGYSSFERSSRPCHPRLHSLPYKLVSWQLTNSLYKPVSLHSFPRYNTLGGSVSLFNLYTLISFPPFSGFIITIYLLICLCND